MSDRVPLSGKKLTPYQREVLDALLRGAFDFIWDLRHWEKLCARARDLDQPPWLVHMAMMEKIFEGEIPPVETIQDRPLIELRTRLERIREQPDKLKLLTDQSLAYMEMVFAAFPEEAPSREDQLFFINFFRKVTRLKTEAPRENVKLLAKKIRESRKKRR